MKISYTFFINIIIFYISQITKLKAVCANIVTGIKEDREKVRNKYIVVDTESYIMSSKRMGYDNLIIICKIYAIKHFLLYCHKHTIDTGYLNFYHVM